MRTMTKMLSYRSTTILLAICLLPSSSAWAQAGTALDPTYVQSWEKWKAEMVDDLKARWLPLSGLFWLKPGANQFGTDSHNPIVLPQGSAPALAGEFDLTGNDVTIKVLPGVEAKIAGKPVTTAPLQSDASGKATMVELGHLRMFVIQRGKRIGIRLRDLASPAIQAYRGPQFYPLNTSYKITAKWIPSDGKKTVDVPDVLGDVTPTPVAGEASFTLNGQTFRLSALGGDPDKTLFFVFKDFTSKTETYPPGRFLDTGPVVNNTVELDFNEAYNPPCAVTPYATCPLPPKQNQLAIAIPAGEKYDHKLGHH
jgi:uncharacterized protein